ncbi:cytochrome P450 2C5-like [Platysternon megacephalum]|uniref:Cytochrome P450 2C5-like n=1 Tax=Platysternon megacephalum TaxID=55544 RepID=A0A4D9EDA6_9SAUR|nr:cytochrome P450 2C5-like [Platysternon megacephalum]
MQAAAPSLQGLSSRLCEAIRDEYSLGQILSVMVAPHQAGESPLQHYNSLLCLSWLQRHVDGVLLFQNDAVLRRTATLLGKKAPVSDMQPQVSLFAMNTYIASCLAGLLYPLKAFTTGSGISMGMEPWELLRSVCPMPTMTFLHIAPACKRGTVFWDSLASSVVHSLPHTLNIVEPGCHSHSLTVCANHGSSAELLEQVVARAEAMYKTNAYLHWYWRYGCEEEDFQHFETLCSMADDYSQLGE